jgi:hypothetical protein
MIRPWSLIKTTQLVVALLLFGSCKKDPSIQEESPYDIILIAGQSNTHQGIGYDPFLDSPDERIKQLGRAASHNMHVIPGSEPLEHWTSQDGEIGFGLTFAKEYADKYLVDGRKVLIIPCGRGQTGFAAHDWNRGDAMYTDAVNRTAHALSLNKDNKLVAILWHQGENDIGWPGYQAALDSTIVNLRRDINRDQNTLFIVGGMVPYFVAQDSLALVGQLVIAHVPKRMGSTGYASPYYPFEIHKDDDTFLPMHYDAKGQRILGKRYFNVFDSLSSLR